MRCIVRPRAVPDSTAVLYLPSARLPNVLRNSMQPAQLTGWTLFPKARPLIGGLASKMDSRRGSSARLESACRPRRICGTAVTQLLRRRRISSMSQSYDHRPLWSADTSIVSEGNSSGLKPRRSLMSVGVVSTIGAWVPERALRIRRIIAGDSASAHPVDG